MSQVSLKKIIIIDFGSQFTQLIARRVRELGVYSEIISHKKKIILQKEDIIGFILSGGPLNVYQNKKVSFNIKDETNPQDYSVNVDKLFKSLDIFYEDKLDSYIERYKNVFLKK